MGAGPRDPSPVSVIGVSDHLASELPSRMRYAQSGKLTFPESALRFVDLDAAQINVALDALERSTDHVRPVAQRHLTSGKQFSPSSARERNGDRSTQLIRTAARHSRRQMNSP